MLICVWEAAPFFTCYLKHTGFIAILRAQLNCAETTHYTKNMATASLEIKFCNDRYHRNLRYGCWQACRLSDRQILIYAMTTAAQGLLDRNCDRHLNRMHRIRHRLLPTRRSLATDRHSDIRDGSCSCSCVAISNKRRCGWRSASSQAATPTHRLVFEARAC